MAETKKQDPLKLMVGEARLSYANIHRPTKVDESDENEKAAYSCVLIIPKTNTVMKAAIDKCIAIAKEEGKKTKWGGKLPPNLKVTLHDGDVEKPDDPNYANTWFLNSRNSKKPGIMVRENGTNRPLTSEDEVYSGCFAWATIVFFPFNKKSSGVGASLQNILKTKDGERLAGGASAEEDFASFSEEFDAGDDMM